MSDEKQVFVTEHILEIRHAASGRFLDVRGLVADYIKAAEIFPHWKIESNMVNFSDSDGTPKTIGGFAGYKSAGVYVYNPDTKNFFEDKAIKFWKTLDKSQHYNIPEINRFGCRTKAFINITKSFEGINDYLYEQFFSSTFREIVGFQENDLQITLELKHVEFKVKLIIGPIHKDEANRYFNFESEHFSDTGIFVDLDVYKDGNISPLEIPKLTKTATQLIWAKLEEIESRVEL